MRWSFANSWSTPTLVAKDGRLAELMTDEQEDALGVQLRAPWSALGRPRAPALRWLADRASTSLEWRVVAHWGGWTDRPITGWHRLIRAFNYQRERYAWDAVRLRLGEPGARSAFDVGEARVSPGDLVARTQLTVARGGASADGERERWGVAVRLDVKAPIGRLGDASGSEGWDAATALLGTLEIAPWLTGHAMAAASARSALPQRSALRGRPWQLQAEASLVFRRGRWALVLEDRVATAVFEDGWAFVGNAQRSRSSAYIASFRGQNQVSVGVRRGGFTLWVSEDVTPGRAYGSGAWLYMSNAPDVAIGLGWTRRL